MNIILRNISANMLCKFTLILMVNSIFCVEYRISHFISVYSLLLDNRIKCHKPFNKEDVSLYMSIHKDLSIIYGYALEGSKVCGCIKNNRQKFLAEHTEKNL